MYKIGMMFVREFIRGIVWRVLSWIEKKIQSIMKGGKDRAVRVDT